MTWNLNTIKKNEKKQIKKIERKSTIRNELTRSPSKNEIIVKIKSIAVAIIIAIIQGANNALLSYQSRKQIKLNMKLKFFFWHCFDIQNVLNSNFIFENLLKCQSIWKSFAI